MQTKLQAILLDVFESIKGKNSSYQKFALTTNLTTVESQIIIII